MSNCACVYCDDPEGYASEYRSISNGITKCYECGRDIQPGEEFQTALWWEDGWCEECDDYRDGCECNEEPDQESYTCLDCLSILKELFCNGYFYGMMKEMLEDHIQAVGDDILSCDMGKLTPRARAMVCDILESNWRDDENG